MKPLILMLFLNLYGCSVLYFLPPTQTIKMASKGLMEGYKKVQSEESKNRIIMEKWINIKKLNLILKQNPKCSKDKKGNCAIIRCVRVDTINLRNVDLTGFKLIKTRNYKFICDSINKFVVFISRLEKVKKRLEKKRYR